ncbi:MAG: hypothetical protein M5U01_40685 [Ardenticatenaceae bacterium]|nr:hypothetical protein [Ardenticatenaceae bacterium]
MTRRKKDPLRPLTEGERDVLGQLSRAQSEPAMLLGPRQCWLVRMARATLRLREWPVAVRTMPVRNW